MNGQSNTNDLQKAIDEITGASAAGSEDIKKELGVPPVPPTTGNGVPGVPTITTHGGAPVGGAASIDGGKPEEAVAAIPEAPIPEQPKPSVETAPVAAPEAAADTPTIEVGKKTSVEVTGGSVEMGGDLAKVRESALQELVPLMDKVEISPEEKFSIYTEVIENTKDKSIAEKALEAAKAIGDEKAKAESLLKLVQMIDTL